MEITKVEIEGIAERRFTRQHRRLFLGSVGGALALLIGLSLSLQPESIWGALAIGIPILAGVLIWGIFWQKAVARYTKLLVEDCEQNPTLTYVSGPTKEQTEIIKT
jgi:hypothetical protein